MINLKINTNEKEININLRKSNNIICRNSNNIIEFYKYFDEVINEKNEDYEITFDYKKITSSNSILLNLMDIESVVYNSKFRKGTILWEYINSLVESVEESEISNLNDYVDNFFEIINQNSIVEYNSYFDIDLSKLFNSFIKLTPNISIKDLYIKLLEMLEIIIAKKFNKTFIIFVDNNINISNLKDYDNLYIFDFSKNKKSDTYDLLYLDELQEINYEILLDNLEIHWPIDFDKEIVENTLTEYFNNYFGRETVNVDSDNLLIIAVLINKMYSLHQKIICNNLLISKVVQSFYSKF